MDPNNSQPTGENQNLNKLEEDLDRLTKEAAATAQPAPETPVQPPAAETTAPTESQQSPQPQPLEVSSAPVESIIPPPAQLIETPPAPPNVPVQDGKKGISLMTIAMTLLIIAVFVAVGYIAYTKFIVPAPSPIQTMAPVQTVLPTEMPVVTMTPQASDSGIVIPSSSPSASPSVSSTPSATPQ